MQVYQILLVDDEPFIIDWIILLLEEMNLECDIRHATSGMEAIALINEHRVDLLITDVCMPGYNGLQVIRSAKKAWPDCCALILSAHPDFQYARAAIEAGVTSYILKTDDDNHITAEIRKALNQIDQRRMPEQSSSAAINSEDVHVLTGLFRDGCAENLSLINNIPICMVVGFPSINPAISTPQALDCLVRYYLSGRELLYRYGVIENRVCWLFQMETVSDGNLIDLFERVSHNFMDTYHQSVNFIISYSEDAATIGSAATSMYEISFMNTKMHGDIRLLNTSNDTNIEHSPEALISRINRYIQQNISGELSLSTLSTLVGYNASYLSRLYLSRMGKNLSSYIAEIRYKYICDLMKDDLLSFAEISERAGFSTRAHFNRFVKRFSGNTPSDLRTALTGKKP